MEYLDDVIGFNTVLTGKYISRLLNFHLKPYKLTAEQWTVLKRLDQLGEMSQTKLSEETSKDQATLTKILDLLERNGFIQRVKNPNDRRSFLICITDAGRKLTNELYDVVGDLFEKVTANLSKQELESYQKVLVEIRKNIQNIM